MISSTNNKTYMQKPINLNSAMLSLLERGEISTEEPLEKALLKLHKDNPDHGFTCGVTKDGTHFHSYKPELIPANIDTPVIFLHAMGGNNINWLPVLGGVRKHNLSYAVDLPEHGMTHSKKFIKQSNTEYVRWLKRFFNETGITKAHLVGHSLGGRVAALFVLEFPEYVASITLLAPALTPSFKKTTDFDVSLIKMVSSLDKPNLSKKMMQFILGRMLIKKVGRTSKGLRYAIEELVRDQQPRSFKGIVGPMEWMDESGDLDVDWSKIAAVIPVSMVFGAKDIYCPSKNILKILPDSISIRYIKQSGHLVPLEHPFICTDQILRSIKMSHSYAK